jgi:hypothetical protein
MTLRDFLLQALTDAGFEPRDVSAVIVPVDDPRVPGGELRLSVQEFGQAAAQVDVTEARRDILIVLDRPEGGYAEGTDVPNGPSRRSVVGWIDGQGFVVVRGDGAQPYPFGPDDLRAGV